MTHDELIQIIEMAYRYKLTTLDLSNVEVTTLSHEVAKWTKLPPEIGKLTHLKELNLAGNGIDSLPVEFCNLVNLEILCLNNNKFRSIPEEVLQLKKILKLFVRSNRIESLDSDIFSLPCIKILDLGYNGLLSLPAEIGKLVDLEELYIESNKLTALPLEIGHLSKLKSLLLNENSLVSPPPEIIDCGTKAVIDYFSAALQDNIRNRESKLFIVGKNGAGKKSLLKALQKEDIGTDNYYKRSADSLHIDHPDENDVTITLNVCDFGEYEIYHATHKYLLTKRSIFLVTWNAYFGFDNAKLYSLLDAIQSKTPESPILIVATHVDVRASSIPVDELKCKYPQIAGFYDVCNLSGRGVDELRVVIARLSANLPLTGEIWPSNWLKVSKAIKSMNGNYMKIDEFNTIIEAKGLAPNHLETFISLLHELGDILYFKDDAKLNNIVFLKPEVVAKSIIRVLESEEIVNCNGALTRGDRGCVWNEFDVTMQNYLQYLMEKFDIAYIDKNNLHFIVVEHLPLESAGYVDYWNGITKESGCHEITMKFYLSATIPIGIPIWFIVRLRRFLTGFFWQTGALFSDGSDFEHLGLIQAFTHDRYLTLTVRGPHPWNFFCLLRDGLELTLERFPGLQVKRTISCEGHDGEVCCHEFDFGLMVKRVQLNPQKKYIECPETFKKIAVSYLLFGIDCSSGKSVFTRMKKLEAGNIDNDIKVNDEIKSLQELTQREFLKQFYSLQNTNETHCPNIFAFCTKEKFEVAQPVVDQQLYLKLYCQSPGNWHPTIKGGQYRIDNLLELLNAIEPFVTKLSSFMKYILPSTSSCTSEDDMQMYELLRDDFCLMENLLKELIALKAGQDKGLSMHCNSELEEDRTSFKALREFLELKDHSRYWGGLKKVLTPEGHILWLCDYHANEFGQY